MSSGTAAPVIVFAPRIAAANALVDIASGGSCPVTTREQNRAEGVDLRCLVG